MAGLWIAFTAAYFSFFYVFQDAGEIADMNLDGYLEVVLLGIPTVALLAGTMWLHESEIDRDLRPRLLGWTVGMALLFALAIHTVVFVIETRFDPGERWLLFLLSIGFGASSGTVTGMLAVRSKQRERARNRSLRMARRTERERTRLEHLNHYLRHEVLNEIQKIRGFTTILDERLRLDGDERDYLDAIQQSSDEIAAFVGSIRTILDASDYDPDLETVDVAAVVESEVRQFRRMHAPATIVVTGPDSAPAVAGDLLNRVFRNLIENAIDHNARGTTITVDVTVDGEWVEVSIRDDGSGIPPERRDRLFDPPESGDHGYGLFLMRNLVDIYGGHLELVDTGPEGTEFLVRLPAADQPDASVQAAAATNVA
ncbi:MAG: sensor histidine kinase [Haloarculaceae archaeon]